MPPLARRQAAAAETRRMLLAAGARLAERTGLTGLSVNLVVEEAGLSKGTFFHHFGDRSNYVLALHREFHDHVQHDISQAMAPFAPGGERLAIAARTYLDACLHQRGLRSLLLEARADPKIADEIAKRNDAFARTITADFTALAWPHSREAARLWIGLVAEAALIELRAGRRQPKLRAAVDAFITSH